MTGYTARYPEAFGTSTTIACSVWAGSFSPKSRHRASVMPADGPIVFETEAIENIPPGFRARETYTRRGPDAFDETFELAEPGKDYQVYSRTRFTRVMPR